MSNEQLIANKYIIKEKKGKGYSAEVYKVEDKETKKNYACKIFTLKCERKVQNNDKKNERLEEDRYFNNEKEILELLKEKKVPNIVNLVACGTENIDLGEGPSKSKYLILEYMEKGDLCQYMNIAPLKETHAKLFFKKIVKAVQSLHNIGVYHRDLKTQNILLDDKFNPLLCDFGFSTITKSGLSKCLGSFKYAAPEIYKCFYDGETVDIFALGVILFNLVTGTFGFDRALKQDIILDDKRVKKDWFYILIAYNMYPKFWEKINSRIGKEVSKEFKDLYVKMVAEKPSKRPTIEEILKDEWMKEINDKNDKEIEALELEIYEDFLEREKLIENSITNKTTIKTTKGDNGGEKIKGDNRGLSETEKNDFEFDILPKIFQEGKYLEYYNKIKGDLNPVKFMNNLTKKLRKENNKKEREYDCKIETSQYKLKFRATFEKIEVKNDEEYDESIMKELEKLKLEEGNEEEKKENQEEEEEEEGNDDDNNVKIFERACSIQIELYEYEENIHLLRYVRKSGELDDFYKLLKYINNCVDDIINI